MVALAALGTVAGACGQPRSLVEMDMTVSMDAEALGMSEASLQISVSKDGQKVRDDAEKKIADLKADSANSKLFHVGLFLPPSVSGKVQVVVVVIDRNKCPLSDPQMFSVDVSSGTSTRPRETLIIVIDRDHCPSDGGATPAPDAAAEATPPQPDAATVDTGCPPDAAVEMTPPPTCEDFCALATKDCSTYYGSVDGCMKTCRLWTPGIVPPNDQVGTPGLGDNTLGCRMYFLMHWTANLKEMFCQAAAPNSSRCTR